MCSSYPFTIMKFKVKYGTYEHLNGSKPTIKLVYVDVASSLGEYEHPRICSYSSYR